MTIISLDLTSYAILGLTIFFSNFFAEMSKEIYHSIKHKTKKVLER